MHNIFTDFQQNSQKNTFFQLVFLFFLVILGSLLGTALIFFTGQLLGLDFQHVLAHFEELSQDSLHRNFIRISLFFNHLFSFILPAVLFGLFFYNKNWIKKLSINASPKVSFLGMGILFMLAMFPLAQFAYLINQQIPLPDWAIEDENQTALLLAGLLKTSSVYELFFNIFIIALIPAIGEEFIFRGIIQNKLAEYGKPVLAIWITAFIFSFIHFQFEGFLARMLLGAALGYLYYWTANLWIPIIAHFVNNAAQILIQYALKIDPNDINIENIDSLPWSITVISLIFVLLIGIFFTKRKIVPTGSSWKEF